MSGMDARQHPAAIFFDLDWDGFVPLRIEVLKHRCRRGERDFVFAGAAAVDDADAELFHVISPVADRQGGPSLVSSAPMVLIKTWNQIVISL